MNKNLLVAALVASGANVAMAENVVAEDSLVNYELKTAQVTATRAAKTTPIAFTNLDKKDIAKRNFGQDFTYLLMGTPSLITTSDAGAGVGYTSLRVRGTDGSRINVTLNGVPVNDAESSTVFWVNMPDLASSVKDVQVQRGAGTSTNGAGAFGASVNMQSADMNSEMYGEFQGSYGSFNTHKETVKFGTGLMNNHWTFDARLSNIGTDGYLDRAGVDLYSYYTQLGYFDQANALRLLVFGGKEKTYHAWNYSTKEQMEAFGRKFNSCGYINGTDKNGVSSRPDIDYDVEGAKAFLDNGGHFNYYDDQTDNYKTTNVQLLFDHRFSNNWKMNVGLHYTKGDGYYQEYKDDRKLYQFGLDPFTDAEGNLQKRADLIRKKGHDSDFGGAIASLQYNNHTNLRATLGGGYNYYENRHFGKVLWVKDYTGDLDTSKNYYQNRGKKNDGNFFFKAEYDFIKGLTGYVDMQSRYVRYQIHGVGDKWAGNDMQQFNIDDEFDFFNPKFGLNWQPNENHRVFASVSMAHKEPTRNNYTDGYINEHPTSERLLDYELGYQFANEWLHAGANFYFMDYKDQLVLTGELNEIGEAVAANVPDSYRAGVELMAGINLSCGFSWDINATLSRNRIKDFTEKLYGHDADWNDLEPMIINHGDTHIAFSPDFILNNRFAYNWKGLEAALQTQYVSDQFMSNANIDEHKLDAYFVSNLSLGYTFQLKDVKSLTIGATVYNIFNEEYENNGWASSDFEGHMEGNKVVMDKRNNYTGYAAQAGTNFMVNLGLKF